MTVHALSSSLQTTLRFSGHIVTGQYSANTNERAGLQSSVTVQVLWLFLFFFSFYKFWINLESQKQSLLLWGEQQEWLAGFSLARSYHDESAWVTQP